jgi:hypothetical protein
MHPAITLPTARVVDWLRAEDGCDAQRHLLEAGRSAGGYLDEIGKTDLALLSAEKWTPPF